MYKDTLTVIKPVVNGPSERAGIKSGDRILFANKQQLFNKKIKMKKLFQILKGEVGTKVNLVIYRKAENKKFTVSVTRDIIPINSIDVATMLNAKKVILKLTVLQKLLIKNFIKLL